MCLVARITLGDVGSLDVGVEIGLIPALPSTLGGDALSTLRGVVLVKMVCNA